MRRTQTLVVAASLVVAALALSGCSSWFGPSAAPANTAISTANAHLQAAATLEQQIQTDGATLDSVPYSSAGANQGLATTASLRKTVAADKVELTAAKAAIDGIQSTDVAANLKQYAKLESASLSTRLTLLDTDLRLYDTMDTLFNGLKKRASSNIDVSALTAVIAQLQQEQTTLTDQISQEMKAASDYFAAQKL
jgi:uncharacterized protein YpmB